MSYFEKTKLDGDQNDSGSRNIEDLLEQIIKQLKIMNLHLAIMTDNQINGEEVE